MTTPDLWFREFKRTEEFDVDHLATPEFRDTHFTDFFGQWLQKGQNSNANTLDEILMEFWNKSRETPPKNSFAVFCVADGGFVERDLEIGKWIQKNVRFVAFISNDARPFDDRSEKSWTLCVVGSEVLNSEGAFLQVASWDTKAFRFYERGKVQNEQFITPDGNFNRAGWIYQAVSTDAFADQTAYLGPFNGHVNGALVMKELHKPWLHWNTDNNHFVTKLSDESQKDFLAAPYLSDQAAQILFSGVQSAESMEPIVENGISKWYNQRRATDFLDSAKKPLKNPSNIKRWIAHLLLTTTTNIIPSLSLGGQQFAPANHFYNEEMLSQFSNTNFMSGIEVPRFVFDRANYSKASEKLGLALLQEIGESTPPGHRIITLSKGTLGGGKVTGSFEFTRFLKVQAGEEENGMFTILQPSYEDAQGVLKMQTVRPGIGLLSDTTINALMMLDFWNPIYSWRRGVLMQYVPEKITFDPTTKTYDLESQLIGNVKKSSHFKNEEKESPEYQFILLLGVTLEAMQTKIKMYFESVVARLQIFEGLVDYLTLAESRRRIYRPLPLNEFGLTLPYALNYGHPPDARFEMTETGTIVPMSSRGLRFFQKLTATQNDGSLAGFDPKIIPLSEELTAGAPKTTKVMSINKSSIPETQDGVPKKAWGCPYRRADAAKLRGIHAPTSAMSQTTQLSNQQ